MPYISISTICLFKNYIFIGDYKKWSNITTNNTINNHSSSRHFFLKDIFYT